MKATPEDVAKDTIIPAAKIISPHASKKATPEDVAKPIGAREATVCKVGLNEGHARRRGEVCFVPGRLVTCLALPQ